LTLQIQGLRESLSALFLLHPQCQLNHRDRTCLFVFLTIEQNCHFDRSCSRFCEQRSGEIRFSTSTISWPSPLHLPLAVLLHEITISGCPVSPSHRALTVGGIQGLSQPQRLGLLSSFWACLCDGWDGKSSTSIAVLPLGTSVSRQSQPRRAPRGEYFRP
jgi:hypothetical protein